MQARLDTVTTTSYNINATDITTILARYEGVTLTKQHIMDITNAIIHLCDHDNITYALDQGTYCDILYNVVYGDHYDPDRQDDPDDDTPEKRIHWDYPRQNLAAYLAYILDSCPPEAEKQLCGTLGVTTRTLRNWVRDPSWDFAAKYLDEPDLGAPGGVHKLQLPPEPIRPTLLHIIKICITLHLAPDIALRLLQLSGHVDLGASDRRSRLAIFLVCRCSALSWDQCHQLLWDTGLGQILGINNPPNKK